MKLNDPFGRMERRHQVGYEVVRDSLVRNNIGSPEAATKIIKDTKMRALRILGAAAAVVLLTYLLLPGAILIVGAVGVLGGAWVISWAINAERYIKRFIEEELGGG